MRGTRSIFYAPRCCVTTLRWTLWGKMTGWRHGERVWIRTLTWLASSGTPRPTETLCAASSALNAFTPASAFRHKHHRLRRNALRRLQRFLSHCGQVLVLAGVFVRSGQQPIVCRHLRGFRLAEAGLVQHLRQERVVVQIGFAEIDHYAEFSHCFLLVCFENTRCYTGAPHTHLEIQNGWITPLVATSSTRSFCCSDKLEPPTTARAHVFKFKPQSSFACRPCCPSRGQFLPA